MPDKELDIKTPGEQPIEQDDTPLDPKDARIAELELLVAQLGAQNEQMSEQLRAQATVQTAVARSNAPRTIGDDWSNKTSAEAKAAGVQHTVRCSDGYYVPG